MSVGCWPQLCSSPDQIGEGASRGPKGCAELPRIPAGGVAFLGLHSPFLLTVHLGVLRFPRLLDVSPSPRKEVGWVDLAWGCWFLVAFLMWDPDKVPARLQPVTEDHIRMQQILKESGLNCIYVMPPHIAGVS